MSASLPEKFSPEEIKRHIDTENMRAQLLVQLAKDLRISELEVNVASTDFFSSLSQILTKRLSHIIDFQASSLSQIIYQVDLNEARIIRLLQENQGNSAALLADEILRREMQKVFYRNVYNGTIQL